jgi:hypothetical protein
LERRWGIAGVQGAGGVKRSLPGGMHGTNAVEEDVGGREEREPGVLMVILVGRRKSKAIGQGRAFLKST